MAFYRPSQPFSTPFVLLKPTYTSALGVHKPTYPTIENGVKFFGTFKSYGGTEKTVDGILSIEDTAEIETWYNPDITSDCLVVLAGTDKKFEIINEPENISLRNQFLKFKVRRYKGGV